MQLRLDCRLPNTHALKSFHDFLELRIKTEAFTWPIHGALPGVGRAFSLARSHCSAVHFCFLLFPHLLLGSSLHFGWRMNANLSHLTSNSTSGNLYRDSHLGHYFPFSRRLSCLPKTTVRLGGTTERRDHDPQREKAPRIKQDEPSTAPRWLPPCSSAEPMGTNKGRSSQLPGPQMPLSRLSAPTGQTTKTQDPQKAKCSVVAGRHNPPFVVSHIVSINLLVLTIQWDPQT